MNPVPDPGPLEELPAYAAALRREVGRLRADHRGERFPQTLHLDPGQQLGEGHACHAVAPDDVPLLDAELRTDLVGLLLDRLGDASLPGLRDVTVAGHAVVAWLTRPGEPVVQDTDLAWWAATSAACDAVGVVLDGFWTVTRTGWLDLRSGQTRTWRRLRL